MLSMVEVMACVNKLAILWSLCFDVYCFNKSVYCCGTIPNQKMYAVLYTVHETAICCNAPIYNFTGGISV
jgi:hypothetical protein